MKNRPFQRILLRKLIHHLFPLVLCFSLIALGLGAMLGMRRWRVTDEGKTEASEQFYRLGERNMRVSPGALTPAGISYVAGEKTEGSFFYEIKNRRLYIFLLPAGAEKENSIPIAVSLREERETADLFVRTYAALLEEPEDSFQGFVSPVILDAVHFPKREIRLIRLGRGLFFAAALGLFLYVILAALFPGVNYHSLRYRRAGFTLPELNKALGNELLFYNGKLAVTEDHLFDLRGRNVDVLRLSEVKYMSQKKGKKGTLLTLSNEEKLYKEFFFRDPDEAEEAVEMIRGY